jgi:hypothetical protein
MLVLEHEMTFAGRIEAAETDDRHSGPAVRENR